MMDATMTLSVVGLGYVGLPVAVAFARAGHPVIGFDVDAARVAALRDGHDATGEVDAADLAAANLHLTADPDALADATCHIVTVPTPISETRTPDLGPLLAASRTVGRALRRGAVVVYESTVYPGATEETCVPVLEAESGLASGTDFSVAYSPERINPGDREHRFATIQKVVAASDAATLDAVADLYAGVVTAGVHRAPSIKTAEAAKVLENTQRDLNIALMNELAVILHRLDVDTGDVLAAANTKWNFLPFRPGLVGGHCIGVDPYYLTHRAQQTGYNPEVILAGRRINDGMGAYVARAVARHLLQDRRGGAPVVTVLGLTFKENVPDTRNTRVVDVVRELADFGITVQVHDPVADAAAARDDHGIEPVPYNALEAAEAVVLAVPHDAVTADGWPGITRLLRDGRGMVADVKGVLDRATRPPEVTLWRL